MGKLTQQQIQGGRLFFNDLLSNPNAVEVAEYSGEKELTINCTQLDGYRYPQYKKASEKKRVLSEWCRFLIENPKAFTTLVFGTRMPQELFNALCKQKDLKRLYIKWGSYPDISAITELQKLEYLYLSPHKEVKSIYDKLLTLPKLKYGSLLKHPELYH